MGHHTNVEAIEKGPGKASSILRQRGLVALTRTRRPSTARTRVGRPHQRETSRQRGRRVRTTESHHAFLQRLTQRVEG